jgi:hypothetical protein
MEYSSIIAKAGQWTVLYDRTLEPSENAVDRFKPDTTDLTEELADKIIGTIDDDETLVVRVTTITESTAPWRSYGYASTYYLGEPCDCGAEIETLKCSDCGVVIYIGHDCPYVFQPTPVAASEWYDYEAVCEDCEEVRRLLYGPMTPGEAWDRFVGEQSRKDFMAYSPGQTPEGAALEYIQAQWSMWGLSENSSKVDEAQERIAQLLAKHIEEVEV